MFWRTVFVRNDFGRPDPRATRGGWAEEPAEPDRPTGPTSPGSPPPQHQPTAPAARRPSSPPPRQARQINRGQSTETKSPRRKGMSRNSRRLRPAFALRVSGPKNFAKASGAGHALRSRTERRRWRRVWKADIGGEGKDPNGDGTRDRAPTKRVHRRLSYSGALGAAS